MPKKNPDGSNVVTFRVTDEAFARLHALAERASRAAGGVPITVGEMARAACLRGLDALDRELPRAKA